MPAVLQIATYDDLRNQAATLSMLIYAERKGTSVLDRERILDVGLAICDVVQNGEDLTVSGPRRYEDVAVVEAFTSLTKKSKLDPKRLKHLALAAPDVRNFLESLRSRRTLAEDAFDAALNFFNGLCKSM